MEIICDFATKEEAFNEHRADFANRVCKLVYNSCDNDIERAFTEIKAYHDYFEDNVRNIYELVFKYIPLFAYYEMRTNGADNYGFNDAEYKANLKLAEEACERYYK